MAPTDPHSPDAVILLGRGGTGAAAREAPQRLAEELQLRMPGCQVVVAFIDKAAPSLPDALDRCAGLRSVVVLPLVAPDEPALIRWLHKERILEPRQPCCWIHSALPWACMHPCVEREHARSPSRHTACMA